MRGSLYEGDVVLINKLAYGARTPITPLSFTLGEELKFLPLFLVYFRMPGYSAVHRNDVVAYNFDLTDNLPVDLREEYVKRCVGIPGDTLRITEGNFSINHTPVESASAYFNYILICDVNFDTNYINRLSVMINWTVDRPKKKYGLSMTEKSAKQIFGKKGVISCIREVSKKSDYDPAVFPNQPFFIWNADYFGPLYVPRKGAVIPLSDSTLYLYQKCIERFEHHKIIKLKNDFLVDGKPVNQYTFSMNYFFMAGDNRNNSIDSRYTGLIPEDHIIGKVDQILFSPSGKSRFFLRPE